MRIAGYNRIDNLLHDIATCVYQWHSKAKIWVIYGNNAVVNTVTSYSQLVVELTCQIVHNQNIVDPTIAVGSLNVANQLAIIKAPNKPTIAMLAILNPVVSGF